MIIADLHLGKSEAYAASGMPVPPGVIDDDLARIEALLTATRADRVLVVGDLLHAPVGLAPAMVELVAAWRTRCRAVLELVPGNHDRRIETVAAAWELRLHGRFLIDGEIAFVHDPLDAAEVLLDHPGVQFVWTGHVHPGVRLKAGGDRLLLPCFYLAPRYGILPAFSRFTGAVAMDDREPGSTAYAIAEDRIFNATALRGLTTCPAWLPASPGPPAATAPSPKVRRRAGPARGRATRRSR